MKIPKRDQIDDYGYPVWDDNSFPLAYLLTFRTFGTWLHGDERTSVKRDGWNRYGHPRYKANETLEGWMRNEMSHDAIILNDSMRQVVDKAIRELCEQRGYGMRALTVRTNHAHAVVSAAAKPERIADAEGGVYKGTTCRRICRERCKSLVARSQPEIFVEAGACCGGGRIYFVWPG